MSKFILITSCEKEQGKTVLALEITKQLANEKRVLFVDISKSSFNSAYYLGYNLNIIYDYVDLLNETCSIDEAKVLADLEGVKFDLIPAPRLETKVSNDTKIFGKLFMLLNGKYDYIIIDGFDLLHDKKMLDYSVLDKIYLITESKIEDLTKTNICLNVLGRENITNVSYIINKYSKKASKRGKMFTPKEMEEMINTKMIGVIDYNKDYELIKKSYLENKIKLTQFETMAEIIIGKL